MPPSGGRIRRTLARSAPRGVVNKLPAKAQAVNRSVFTTGQFTAKQGGQSKNWSGRTRLELLTPALLGLLGERMNRLPPLDHAGSTSMSTVCLRISSRSWVGLNGLVRKIAAPDDSASSRLNLCGLAVSMMTGMDRVAGSCLS